MAIDLDARAWRGAVTCGFVLRNIYDYTVWAKIVPNRKRLQAYVYSRKQGWETLGGSFEKTEEGARAAKQLCEVILKLEQA